MAEWDNPNSDIAKEIAGERRGFAEGTSSYKNASGPTYDDKDSGSIWMRGLYMVILAFLFGVAETVLLVMAVLQFLWMLFSKERNQFLATTGDTIGKWLMAVSQFQTGATDEKPFPWRSLD